MSDPLQGLRQALDQLEQCLPELELLKNENEKLKSLLSKAQREKRATQQAFETLKNLREKDRQTIRAWQDKLNEIGSEAMTQDIGSISSSPPLETIAENADPESEECIHSESDFENGKEIEIDNMSQRVLPLSIGVDSMGTTSDASEINDITTDQLMKQDWHPEDFVLNSEQNNAALDVQETPAGYWEVDFPNSSQIDRQKQAAKHQIRAEGQRRLKEALSGGRYAFKDKRLRRSIRKRRA